MGPSLGTSLGLSSAVADPHPVASPHLLSCSTVLYGPGPPTLLLYDPCPMAGGRHRWSQERWLRWGAPWKSARRIAAGHLLGAVADELWDIVAHSPHPHSLYFHTWHFWFGRWFDGEFDVFLFHERMSWRAEDTLEFTLTKRTSVCTLTYFSPKANSP